eukprot:Tbor_TRINITY_DN4497_c1_g3::TRINITY_DN4497_c1_g3_i1::g.8090::m.8090
MSLSCYFGIKLNIFESSAPVIPPSSTLVITNICVSQDTAFGKPVTIYVQCHNFPKKLAIGTLDPDGGVFHLSCEMMFSSAVAFYLEPFDGSRSDSKGDTNNRWPSVHITGYYECDEDHDDPDNIDEEIEEEEVPQKPQKGNAKKTPIRH